LVTQVTNYARELGSKMSLDRDALLRAPSIFSPHL
jgi:hypothetical protein